MTKKLHISEELSLPLETVTQTIAIIAKKRMGKSYLARRLAEQLFKAGQQIVIVDPKGDWWGIRSSADGKSPGLPIVIFGGDHGHVRLEPGGGELVAKIVVEQRVSVLLDLADLRKHEVATFMAHFLETLYRLKHREQYRTPMMLIIDEADAIAPQAKGAGGSASSGGNVERMLGAANDIVRRGGQRGIGCTLITQRTAVLSKDVLTQAQILIALRTIAPQDLRAMDAWIDVHGTEEQRATLKASLPSLPTGNAWVWSPGWPTDTGLFKRIHTLPIETFDSGSTPRPGERRIEPKTVADVDLDAIRLLMAETIERAKLDDPKSLRGEIAELKKQLAAKGAAARAAAPPAPKPERVEVPVFAPEDRKFLTDLRTSVARYYGEVGSLVQGLNKLDDKINGIEIAVHAREKMPASSIATSSPRTSPKPLPEAAPTGQGTRERAAALATADVAIGKCERALLRVLAQRETTTMRQLAILSGYSISSSGFTNALGRLRSGALAVGGREAISITKAGRDAAGHVEPMPTGARLVEHWKAKLGKCERAVLDVVIAERGKPLNKEAIAERSKYSVTSSGFTNALGELRGLKLIEGYGEDIRAAEIFFEDAR